MKYAMGVYSYTPGIQNMQWGYIVFVFSVCLSVCQSFNIPTLPRNLKFCTHNKYDKLYCGKENKDHGARSLRVISLCCSFY